MAFIYDRCATQNTFVLELRLRECAKYTSEHGWGFGGWWVDEGDDALTDDHRPGFDGLERAVRQAGDRPKVCLVFDWARLSNDDWNRRIFARRVMLAGGWVETVRGETTKPSDAQRGLLTGAPQVIA
ncbi:recombinase family protein [Streptomyces sp. RPT161]|uniref:recombinase family protein n=1 Tax=Streptomyces sp. RPT161 TaxID=3015993 RepID=UPI0022B937AD|nr:recombinase family protein [Streptomyces sp. RPT161]